MVTHASETMRAMSGHEISARRSDSPPSLDPSSVDSAQRGDSVQKAARGRANAARPWWLLGREGGLLHANRALVVCLVVAVFMHLPAVPAVRHVLSMLDFTGGDTEAEEEGEAFVPIELDMEAMDAAPPKDEPPPPPPKEPEQVATPPEPAPTAPPEPEVVEPPPPKPEKVERPLDDIPDPAKFTSANNVQIVLIGARLREHPVGKEMGPLLGGNPQWEGFFKGTGLDPVKDIDVMILAGPQMRISGEVVAIVQFSGDMARVKSAIDNLIKSSDPKGEWLQDAPVMAARASADNAERIFAFAPDKKLLYVIPSPYPSKEVRERLDKKPGRLDKRLQAARAKVDKQLERVKAGNMADLSTAPYAVDAFMVEPWKLQGPDGKVQIPVVGGVELIPKSLKTGRLTVVTTGSEADVTITLTAEDAAQAKAGAETLNTTWASAKIGARWEYKIDLPDVTFIAQGKQVVGKGHFSQAALEAALEVGRKETEESRKKKKKPAKSE